MESSLYANYFPSKENLNLDPVQNFNQRMDQFKQLAPNANNSAQIHEIYKGISKDYKVLIYKYTDRIVILFNMFKCSSWSFLFDSYQHVVDYFVYLMEPFNIPSIL